MSMITRRAVVGGAAVMLFPAAGHASAPQVTYWTHPGRRKYTGGWSRVPTLFAPLIQQQPVLGELFERLQKGEGTQTEILDDMRFTAMAFGENIVAPNMEVAIGPGWVGVSRNIRMVQRPGQDSVIVTAWLPEVCGNPCVTLTRLNQPFCIPCPVRVGDYSTVVAAQGSVSSAEVARRTSVRWG